MRIKYAFLLRIRPEDAADYIRRHDEIWPEMLRGLSAAGITEYTIHLDPLTGLLVGVQYRDADTDARLERDPVMARWREYMKDLLIPWPDTGLIARPLKTVFEMA